MNRDAHTKQAAAYLRENGGHTASPDTLGRIYDSLEYAQRMRSNAWRLLAQLWLERRP